MDYKCPNCLSIKSNIENVIDGDEIIYNIVENETEMDDNERGSITICDENGENNMINYFDPISNITIHDDIVNDIEDDDIEKATDTIHDETIENDDIENENDNITAQNDDNLENILGKVVAVTERLRKITIGNQQRFTSGKKIKSKSGFIYYFECV